MEKKFHYSSQHLEIILNTLKTALERNQDSQEKCLIPGLRHGKYTNKGSSSTRVSDDNNINPHEK